MGKLNKEEIKMLIPIMPTTEPTEEDKAFAERVNQWLLASESPNGGEAEQRTFNLGESTKRVLELRRRCKETYIALGKELNWVKQNLEHGQWLEWLKRVDIHPKTAQVYMRIAENPRLYDEAHGNLANVRVGKFVSLTNSGNGEQATSRDGHETVEEVIDLIDKLQQTMSWLSSEDKENYQVKAWFDSLHAKLHRFKGLCPKCIDTPKWENGACPNCGTTEADIKAEEEEDEQQKMKEDQEQANLEAKRETLVSHPAWCWVKRLVVNGGISTRELRPEEWVKAKFGQSYDELAQGIGYEQGTIPTIGRTTSCEMMCDEQFKHDLTEAFWQGVDLRLIKLRKVGAKRRGTPLRAKKPSKATWRDKTITKWEAQGRPIVYLDDGQAYDNLDLVRTSELKKIAELIDNGDVVTVDGHKLLIKKSPQ